MNGRAAILVVDDDPGMRRGLSRVLSRQHDVLTAGGVAEAMEKAAERRFDVAIIDIRLVDGDGYELHHRLKHIQPDMDMILMTGSTSEPDEKLYRALVEDVFYFFFKPIDRRVLLALVDRCLRLRRAQQANADHLRRLSDDLERARRFQHSLLPRGPLHCSGWRLEGRLRSCDAVGGDAFAYRPLGDSVQFSLLDLAGHGVQAAMYAGMLTSMLRAARRLGSSPETTLSNLLQNIDFLELPRYASMVYGLLQRDGMLRFFNAGHPDMIWLRDGGIERLSSTGPILTATDLRIPYLVEQIQMAPGDRICVYSDGVTECLSPDECFWGPEGLSEVLRCTSGWPISSVLDHLLEALDRHRGERPHDDDVTLLLIERTRDAGAAL
ncbi:SpoIIE family protein phosphatase [bacterium]|nr:SpoIIE family protein phosphatase [candidate division CSSED10-310 bacterium]